MQAHCWNMHAPLPPSPMYIQFQFFKVEVDVKLCDHGNFQWI